jgi:hypothetical protein
VLLKDHLERFVDGPHSPSEDDPEGIRGQRVTYDESQENQAQYADQLAASPGWYEVDVNDVPVFPKAEDETPAPPAVPPNRWPSTSDAYAKAQTDDKTDTTAETAV